MKLLYQGIMQRGYSFPRPSTRERARRAEWPLTVLPNRNECVGLICRMKLMKPVLLHAIITSLSQSDVIVSARGFDTYAYNLHFESKSQVAQTNLLETVRE